MSEILPDHPENQESGSETEIETVLKSALTQIVASLLPDLSYLTFPPPPIFLIEDLDQIWRIVTETRTQSNPVLPY